MAMLLPEWAWPGDDLTSGWNPVVPVGKLTPWDAWYWFDTLVLLARSSKLTVLVAAAAWPAGSSASAAAIAVSRWCARRGSRSSALPHSGGGAEILFDPVARGKLERR